MIFLLSEYTCKIKVLDLGMDGGGYEGKDGSLLSETDEIPYECPPRSKHNLFLPKPINLAANRWYLVWARIAGPSRFVVDFKFITVISLIFIA